MSIAIKVENLSKQYRLGEVGTGTLSHDLNRWWAKIRGKEDPFAKIGSTNDRTQKADSDYVWALKDINFEINQGDAVGIIGRNGAGKSTLLKILSRTTLPTTGSIKMKGRIASLLEVGTGFHPEMTGRENIYQNGAILGMTRREITRKFDEIVDFSGCERYIDTPVKRYSSGMYVRLAFAVAAHLESEILIVDEVLAVGDAEFQKKCLGKMGDISKGEGRTVLFVSHNMGAVKSLCNNGLLLAYGSVLYKGKIKETIEQYVGFLSKVAITTDFKNNVSTYNTGEMKFYKFYMADSKGIAIESVNYMADIYLFFELYSYIDLHDAIIDVKINTIEGISVVYTMNNYSTPTVIRIKKGLNRFMCKMQNSLQPDKYTFTIGVHRSGGATIEYLENIYMFEVLPVSLLSGNDYPYDFKLGVVRTESTWKVIV